MSARRTKGAACATGAGRYRPYPAYKDSGVEWLGEIPAHWEVKRLKHLANMQAGSAITSETIEPTGDYPVFGGNGIRGFTDSFTHEGDFPLIGRQGALCGCVNLASGKFWASEHAVVARPARDVDAFWLAALLESMTLNSYSQSAAQPGIAVDTIGALSAPAPPFPEQHSIAAFLDRETARIDALVAKKERLIALLQEQRTALITRAVTKGLDPTVPMKDSGVEWLGEIPAHWEVKPLKRVFSNLDSMRVPLSGEERATMTKEYPYYGASGIIDHVEDYLFEEPLILVAEDGANLYSRSTPLAFIATGRYWVNNHAHILKPLEGDVSYWAQVLSSVVFDPWISGSAQPKLTGEKLGSIPLPVLPPVERRAIAAFLDRETARIDALIATVRDAIHRLKELRTALISAAVTGKIDVRSLAEASAQGGREVA